MKKVTSIEFEREGISCEIHDNIAVLKLMCNAFETLTDLEKDRNIFEWFDLIENNENINGILIINDANCFSESAFNKFLSDVAGEELDLNKPGQITRFQKKQIRAIEINMLMAYIRKILNFKKLIIIAMHGEVVTPFFGISLACDIRIVAENTFFSLSHTNYAIHPSAALPFFLPRYIGPTKANEYLLFGGKISAKEAKELNLVNKVLSDNDFEKNAIEESKKYCNVNNNYVKVTKTLMNNYEDDLAKYFEKESHYLYN